MSAALRITLAAPDGALPGDVARLGEDDLSFMMPAGPSLQRTVAFALEHADGDRKVWGTLKIVGEAAAPYGRRVRGHILSINSAHQALLRRWQRAADLALDERTEHDDDSVTTPTVQDPDTDSQTRTEAALGSSCFSPLSGYSAPASEPALPLGGRVAIRAALRRGLRADDWQDRSDPGRSCRLRRALARGRHAISAPPLGELRDMAPVDDATLRAEWED